MANPTWPLILPAPLAAGTATAKPTEDIIATKMDAGPVKVRRRYTPAGPAPGPFSLDLMLDQAGVATLEAFYSITLNAVGLFDWTDFTTGQTVTFGFLARPGYRHVSGTAGAGIRWAATLQLERQP